MSNKDKIPMTLAIRDLMAHNVDFTTHLFQYEKKGGTAHSAQELGVNEHSGYQVGGTSPFGIREKMPVYMEKTILDLPRIYINGGKRGFLVGMDPKKIVEILSPNLVNVGIK